MALAPAAFLDANADRAILEYANNENDPVLLEAALLVLKRGLAYDSLRDALGEAGVIGTALNLLCDLEVNWPETVRSLSAMILGDVCNKSDKNQARHRILHTGFYSELVHGHNLRLHPRDRRFFARATA